MSGIQNISQYTKGVEICVEHFPSKYVGKEPKEGIDCNTQKDTAKKRNKSEEPPSWDVLAKMKETTCCWSLLLSIISCFCPNWYFSSSTTGNFYHFKPSPQPPPTLRVVLSIFGPSPVTAMSLCMMVDGLGVGPFLRSVAQQTWAQSKPGAVVTWMVRDSQLMEGHGDGGWGQL